MIFITFDSEYRVNSMHYMPFDPVHGLHKTKTELEAAGALVENIPEAPFVEGKTAVIKYNPVSKTIYFEYIDRVKTKEELLEEKVAQLEAENANINYALMMGGLI